MKNTKERILYDTGVRTFEELGYLVTTPVLNDSQMQAVVDAGMQVEFRGVTNGRLAILISGDLLPTLATNMMGEETTPSRQLQNDALGEITNVLCGNALPLILGTREEIHLHTPTMITDENHVYESNSTMVSVEIGLEEHGRAEVFFQTIEADVPGPAVALP